MMINALLIFNATAASPMRFTNYSDVYVSIRD